MRFAVGYKIKGRTQHVIVEADDALAAALKVKEKAETAKFTYVRPQNKRGDSRHPALEAVDLN